MLDIVGTAESRSRGSRRANGDIRTPDLSICSREFDNAVGEFARMMV